MPCGLLRRGLTFCPFSFGATRDGSDRLRGARMRWRLGPSSLGWTMPFLPVNEQMDLIRKGTVEIIPEEELVHKLERSLATDTPLRIKQGFDPTAPHLHLGHTVSLQKLREFQDLGHSVIFLIGDFTATIGDPSGATETRPGLTPEAVRANAQTYKEQVFKVLDPSKTSVSYNSAWLSELRFQEVIRLAGMYTVARMLEREDFAERLRQNRPIRIHELLYPLVQAYDSVALRADVELGGLDQRVNLVVARDIQREFGQEPQVAVLTPLLVGTDGVKKMSKAYGNSIGITELPEEMYGKTMSIPDELIYPYFELVTPLSLAELAEIKESLEAGKTNPRDMKRRLARTLVGMFHGSRAAREAERAFDRLFVERTLPEDIPKREVRERWLPKALVEAGVLESTSEARRRIRQEAVRKWARDGQLLEKPEKIFDVDCQLEPGVTWTIQFGRGKFVDIRVVGSEDREEGRVREQS